MVWLQDCFANRVSLTTERLDHILEHPEMLGMADKIKVWFDAEADYLEVRFADVAGYMQATSNDAVMERLDEGGKIIGFSILGVSRFSKEHPLTAELSSS